MRIGTVLVATAVVALVAWYVIRVIPGHHRDRLSMLDARYEANLRSAAQMRLLSLQNELPAKWEDLLPIIDSGLLTQMEQAYLRLPARLRGFKDSIYEKHVFVVPPLETHISRVDGPVRIFMMTSQPRRTSGTNLLRSAFWQSGTEVCSGSVQEAEIQAIFQKGGRSVPQPPPAAPATPLGWHPPNGPPPLDRETLREILRERGYGPVAIFWGVYWPWSGVGVAVVSIVGLMLVVRSIERRRKT